MIKRFFFLLVGFSTVAFADTGTQPVNLVQVGASTVSVATDGGILTHTTNGGSGGTSATYGAAFPSIGTPAGGVGLNGQFQTFAVDASSAIKVNVINVPTVITSSSGVNASTMAVVMLNSLSVTLSSAGASASTAAVSQQGNWSVSPGTGTQPVEFLSAPTVIMSSNGVNASTVAVVMLNSLSVTLSSSGVNASTTAAVILGNVSVNQHGVTIANWVSTASVQVSNWVSSVSVSNWSSTESVVVSNWVSSGTTVIFSSNGVTASTTAVVILGIPAVSQSGNWGVGVNNWVSTASVAVSNWVSTVAAIPVNSYTVTQGTPTYWVISQSTFTGTLADNGVAAATNRIGTTDGIYQNAYLNGTAATQGRNAAQSIGTDGLLWTASLPALRPASFSASTGTIVPATTATHIAALCGNASNTVLLYGVRVSCTETTAGNVPMSIQKSTMPFIAVYSTMDAVAQDTNYTGAVSSATWFLANPTNSGPPHNIDFYKLGCMATGTATPNDIYISPADWRMKPIVLRGTTQCVSVNLNSTTVTGGSFSVTFDWLETSTITP